MLRPAVIIICLVRACINIFVKVLKETFIKYGVKVLKGDAIKCYLNVAQKVLKEGWSKILKQDISRSNIKAMYS